MIDELSTTTRCRVWRDPGPSRGIALPRRRRRTPNSEWTRDRKYAVLVDAGSSGSRLQIYSWIDPNVSAAARSRNGEKLKVLPQVEKGTEEGTDAEWQWKVEPGISSFGGNPAGVREYLAPLFEHAKETIPAEKLAETPVYVMATAGMRFLPEAQQRGVIRETCTFIDAQTPFAMPAGCSEHVQVITGEQEGLLGWIAINYLLDGFHFKQDDDMASAASGSQGKSTFGFLDMGGASTQIAFEPSHKALSKVDDPVQQEEDLTSVTLRLLDGTQVTHDVFVTTFLGFGTNKARERYEERLTTAASAVDPCLPLGATTPRLNASAIAGTGSFSQCLTSLAPLLDKTAPCSHPPCLFHGIHVPPIDFSINHFIGVSEYWFSSDDVFKLGGVYDYVEFQRAAEAFCSRPWSELQASHEWPPQVDESRLKMQCFKAAWMVTVLHDGIGLPRVIDHKGTGDGKQHVDEVGYKAGQKNLDAGESTFQSVNEVGGTAVSWTLGKAVLEATKDIRPAGAQSSPSSSLPLHPAMLFVSAALLLSLIVLTMLTRGSSPGAKRRRAAVRRRMRHPCGDKDDGDDGSGEYMLANMEEGGDVDGGGDDGDTGSETDSTAAVDSKGNKVAAGNTRKASSATTSRRRWLLSYLPLPLRRIVLSTSSHLPGTQSSTKRRRDRRGEEGGGRGDDDDDSPPAPPLLRGVSASAMRDARPISPSLSTLPSRIASPSLPATTTSNALISRPASRNISRPASRNAVGATSPMSMSLPPAAPGQSVYRSSPLASPGVAVQGGESYGYFASAISTTTTPRGNGSMTPVLNPGTNANANANAAARPSLQPAPFSMQSISQAMDRNASRTGGKCGGSAAAGSRSSGFLAPAAPSSLRVGKNK